jgi:hypothetical protein
MSDTRFRLRTDVVAGVNRLSSLWRRPCGSVHAARRLRSCRILSRLYRDARTQLLMQTSTQRTQLRLTSPRRGTAMRSRTVYLAGYRVLFQPVRLRCAALSQPLHRTLLQRPGEATNAGKATNSAGAIVCATFCKGVRRARQRCPGAGAHGESG